MPKLEQVLPSRLGEYAAIPIWFEVQSEYVLEEVRGGLEGLRLREQPVASPYTKDYDLLPDGGPQRWPEQFDISNWGIFLALDGGRAVGGAAVAWDTPAVHMLQGRMDVAVLWDLRVAPGARRRGVGTALFRRAAAWARERGCTRLRVETQNVNVPACRFYAREGCTLATLDRHAYVAVPEVAHEVMLIWTLPLEGA
jgi:GNAT superfamily N-acetyltransferase